ncbi:MAG: lipocalin family protein [Tahibacter sp.]
MRTFLIAGFALLLVIVVAIPGCVLLRERWRDHSHDLTTRANIDLARYMGAWHVIANIPYFAERGKIASRDEYALRNDGRIDNVYVYRKSFDAEEQRTAAIATVVPGSNNAQWKIRFLGFLSVDYLVLDVAPDYSWALIGYPDRSLGWIFSRSPQMDDALYRDLLERLRGYGYDIAKFQRVAQIPAQQGQAGFQ